MNSLGRLFRLSVFGESHGPEVGVLIDGCPPGLALSEADFEPDLSRRRAGALGTTPRHEADLPVFKSGVYRGHTTGAPLLIAVQNQDVRSADYDHLKTHPRPGHADFTAQRRFLGFNDPRGGGHFSGRLTLALVLAGVVAKRLLPGLSIEASLVEAGGISDIKAAVQAALADGDSIGGVIACSAHGLPVGLGEPFFDSVESLLAHALFAIPAVKGVEFGAGFGAASMRGSVHNDLILDADGRTASNHAGGINGGLTNGNALELRVAIKPTSSILKPQETFDLEAGTLSPLAIRGRHDACIALRAPVVVEAVVALVFADLMLIHRALGADLGL